MTNENNLRYRIQVFQVVSRGDGYLILNANKVLPDGTLKGCANILFNGDYDELPNNSELGGMLEVHGVWMAVPPNKWTRYETTRLMVDAWRPIKQTAPEPKKEAKPKRRTSKRLDSSIEVISATNEKPIAVQSSVPVRTKQRRTLSRTQPPREAIAASNDWYASGGDSLDSINWGATN